jgi:HEAT repeat protein
MTEGTGKFENLFEAIRSGDTRDLHVACDEVTRLWKEVPVEPLLALKTQLQKMEMEQREANLDEALISVAEKRPGPFVKIASEPEHPLWRACMDVLSMEGDASYLDLFISLLKVCPKKQLVDLIRAIGRFRDEKAVRAVSAYLSDKDEGVFFETVMALKGSGEMEALKSLKDCLLARCREDDYSISVMEEVIREMERATGGS